MLTKKQMAVLTVILDKCRGNNSCLTSIDVIFPLVKAKISVQKLKSILTQLELEDYIDVINCDKNGKDMLCITPHVKSQNINREKKILFRNLMYKICFAVLGSVVAFAVTKILTTLIK